MIKSKISLSVILLITGANSGIGQACAVALARAGADVVVNYVVGETDTVIEVIEAEGRKGIAIKANVSNEAEVDAMFKQAVEQFGTLDILVANAGLQRLLRARQHDHGSVEHGDRR